MATCTSHHKFIESALDKAEKLCLKNKIKLTELRKNIFIYIWQSHKPIKAYDILQALQEKEANAKPITVYRALDFLVKNHMVHKLTSDNTFFGCTHPGKAHNCYFLICKKCNMVEEGCKNDLIKGIYNNLDQANFKIEYINLEIHGICRKC